MTRTSPRRRVTGERGRPIVVLLLLALLTPFLLMLSGGAATAAEEDEGGEECGSAPDTSCIQVSYPGAEADPAPGIEFTLTLPSGETVDLETDDSGVARYEIDETGQYSVAVNTRSFPDGVEMEAGAPTEGQRNVSRLGSGQPIGFVFSIRAEGYSAETPFTDELLQGAASGLRLGLVLALAAVGLSLIYGTTGLSSFSHAEQVTLGGVVCYLLVQAGLPFLVAAALTVVIAGGTGYLQDVAMWKPLRRRGLGLTQMMIVTIGLSLALQYVYQILIGGRTVRLITDSPKTIEIGPVVLTQQSYIAMAISIVVLTAVGFALLRTRLGRATRAVSDNPALASASGIDVDRVIRIVWVISTALAGLAGILLALVLNGIKWDSGLQILLLLFAAVTLGGLGTAFGALVGALIIGLVVEVAPVFGVPGDLKYASALLILILLLLVRPQGLLGRAGRVG